MTPSSIRKYKNADKSLTRTGRKQANVSVRMAWIFFGALPCREKKNLMTARFSMSLKSRASLTCFRARFPVELRTYQHPGYNENKQVTSLHNINWLVFNRLSKIVGRCVVGCEHCSHPTTQRPTTATNHIQQNQNNTPTAVTGPLISWRWA